jgi:hypothetical protein
MSRLEQCPGWRLLGLRDGGGTERNGCQGDGRGTAQE